MERPLTKLQREAMLAAQDTFFGDTKLPDEGYGRQMRGLRLRGLVEGDKPHVYLTDAGKSELVRMEAGNA